MQLPDLISESLKIVLEVEGKALREIMTHYGAVKGHNL